MAIECGGKSFESFTIGAYNNVRISNCVVGRSATPVPPVTYVSSIQRATNVTLRGNELVAVMIVGGQQIVLDGNHITGFAGSGDAGYSEGSAFYSNNASVGSTDGSVNVSVTNNTIDQFSRFGVYLNGGRGNTITNNRIDGSRMSRAGSCAVFVESDATVTSNAITNVPTGMTSICRN